MIGSANTYNELSDSFLWPCDERLNIAEVCCDRWASDPGRIALIEVDEQGENRKLSFADLQSMANRLANSLVNQGVSVGDRVGIYLPQCAETAYSHIACYKLGAIAVPLFSLFGPDALLHRMQNCQMDTVITDARGLERLAGIRDSLDHLKVIYTIDSGAGNLGALDLHSEMEGCGDQFETRDSLATDPAVIIYTSGTTGSSKGAVHGHKVLIGHIPGVQVSHDLFPQPDDIMWSPADWAWIGGLFDVLLPSLYFGIPVVARRMLKFDAEEAFSLIERYGIRNMFLPPTALKMMRQVESPEKRWDLKVRSIASGGEALGEELLDWGKRVFGLTINEFYGQTECNVVVSSCGCLGVHRPGSIGKAVPGHVVAIVDNDGNVLGPKEVGNIAVRSPDPVMFLEYWGSPDATRAKFVGEWLLTGDMGSQDEDGYFEFMGRDDDVITSAGYRIGPAPIENCLLKHPAVRMAAVVGKPDALRTEIVKAFVVLANGYVESAELSDELKEHVKKNLAAHEYPREIVFIGELPQTATGKIIRSKLREF